MKSIGTVMVILATIAIFLGGCCGGGTKVEVPQPTSATTGQQLMDLQKDFENGAINREQYDRMKADIIEKSGK